MFALDQIWLIPALPLAAAVIGAFTPRRRGSVAIAAALVALAGSLALSLKAAVAALAAPAVRAVSSFTWFTAGTETVRLGWILDPLTAVMLVLVTVVGLLIFIFSTGYMGADPNRGRFFCFLSLFASAMLGLLLAGNLLLLFICWEIVGLASYLLIGFWFQRPRAAAAAKKAFITTRIGDLGLLLGLVWLNHACGTLQFYDHGGGCLERHALAVLAAQRTVFGLALPTAIGLLIFWGAAGKSGQFPLHVWLPDAMEGPTPVSALIHAATMVAAGVFLLARTYPLLSADQSLRDVPLHALTVIAGIGALTALLGAAVAVAQTDIKRILAFSTISQLGYMVLAIGVGSWVAAIFHLLTHAVFKALLFLGAGSVIHGNHHEQDIRRMGGLGRRMKITFATFSVGMMALAGFPFLFSGFWSKEAILHAAAAWDVSRAPLAAGLVGVVLTAFYMTRLLAEVFGGTPRTDEAEHARESPASMTVPLVLLAAGAIGIGFLGTPAFPWIQSHLSAADVPGPALAGMPGGARPASDADETGRAGESGGGGLTAVSITLVALGVGAGWALYGRRPRAGINDADPLTKTFPDFHHALAKGLGVDRFYARTVVRLASLAALLSSLADNWVWDGAVRLTARLSRLTGRATRAADENGLQAGFASASGSVRGTGRAYSRLLSGDGRGHIRLIALGFAVLVLLALYGGTS